MMRMNSTSSLAVVAINFLKYIVSWRFIWDWAGSYFISMVALRMLCITILNDNWHFQHCMYPPHLESGQMIHISLQWQSISVAWNAFAFKWEASTVRKTNFSRKAKPQLLQIWTLTFPNDGLVFGSKLHSTSRLNMDLWCVYIKYYTILY